MKDLVIVDEQGLFLSNINKYLHDTTAFTRIKLMAKSKFKGIIYTVKEQMPVSMQQVFCSSI